MKTAREWLHSFSFGGDTKEDFTRFIGDVQEDAKYCSLKDVAWELRNKANALPKVDNLAYGLLEAARYIEEKLRGENTKVEKSCPACGCKIDQDGCGCNPKGA